MASNRVLIMRIAGCGDDAVGQYVFTSRAGLSYLGSNEVPGVIADMSQQFTSEIGMFASMGSDPTTSLSLLTTSTTLHVCNSRAQTPVRNNAGSMVTVESYVQPDPLMQFDVSDGTAISIGTEYRVNATTFVVTGVTGNSVTALRTRGSAFNPIAMTKVGDSVVGPVVYKANSNAPQGGIDGLPVVLSTAEIDASSVAQESIIFRGFISRVSNDTSAGGTNQIKIECASLLGFAQNALFIPPVAKSCSLQRSRQIINIGGRYAYGQFWLGALGIFDPRTDGFAYDGSTTLATAYDALQLRTEDQGGVLMRSYGPASVRDVSAVSQTLAAASVPGLPIPDGESGGWTFITTFKKAHYGNAQINSVGIAQFENASYHGDWDIGTETESDVVVESCFLSDTPANLIVDLLLGTVRGSYGSEGYRSAQQSSWLPFDGVLTQPSDLIDYASLLAIVEGREDVFPRVQFTGWDSGTVRTFFVLPYEAGSDKTIGDILKRIMEKLGACMLFDRGTIKFVSWASANAMPTPVTDTALAAPSARLNFDRSACLQMVNCDVVLRLRAFQSWTTTGAFVEQPIPVINVTLGPSQRGKSMKVGTFRQLSHGLDQAIGLSSFAFANAAIVRYSQPAATMLVSLRDSAVDLDVGQSVIVSTDYLPNAYGTMGIENASGIVLKAARSWSTPTTDYAILLTGYLNAVSGVALVAPSGRITVIGATDLKIADNDFTRAAPVSAGSPVNDADAFFQVKEISSVYPLPVQLLDQYGTLKATDTCTVDVANSRLVFSGAPFGGSASIGDIVCLDTATNYFPATMWDAFQADAFGEVAGSTSNTREWSS